jgi:predicted DNA-binding transcriptional regulator AlpA
MKIISSYQKWGKSLFRELMLYKEKRGLTSEQLSTMLGYNRSSFNRRKKDFAYCSIADVEKIVEFLEYSNTAAFDNYKKFVAEILNEIKERGFSNKYVFNRLGISETTFYRKINNPDKWTFDELEELEELLIKTKV